MLPTIQIKDNFLTKKELNILQNNTNKISYGVSINNIGNFGFRHQFDQNKENN
jgi:hypothetical protein